MATIRISINEDIERILEALKVAYPTLDYPELFKLGLSELYHKREFEARQAWMDNLPRLEVSEEDAREIAEARAEIRTSNRKPVTAKDLINALADD